MTDTITLTGIVATPPKSMQTTSGISICTFRLASSHRRFDRSRDEWVESETNWYTITSFRHLADNVAESISKGEHVVVLGRLRVRSWENGDRSGTTVEVDAEAIGHDLLWGRTRFTRVPPPRAASPAVAMHASSPAEARTDGPPEPETEAGTGALSGFGGGAVHGAQEPAHTPTAGDVPPADPARPLVANAWPDTAAATAPPEPSSAALATVGAGAQDSWHADLETPF